MSFVTHKLRHSFVAPLPPSRPVHWRPMIPSMAFAYFFLLVCVIAVGRWVLGEWTPCSVTCGDGIQTRDLSCKQEISATLTMRVHEGACLNPAPTAPRVRNCNAGHCAKWHVSDWGKVINHSA